MSFEVKLNHNVESLINVPYAFDVVDANKKRAIEKHGKNFIIDFGIGDPSDPTPKVVREAVKKSVEETKADGYPSTPGKKSFKESVAKYMKKRFGVALELSEIVATYGSKYACSHLPLYFINPGAGEYTLCPNPGYPPYATGTVISGGKYHLLNIMEENDFLPVLSEIPKDVVGKSKILYVNSPHSPTARVYPKDYLKECVDFCLDNNIMLVSDECYADLYYNEPPKSVLEIKGADECALVLHSLSKRSMMTGYSVGFCASKNPQLLKPYDSLQRKTIQGLANIVQDAASVALLDEKHALEMRLEYQRRMKAFVPALEEYGMNVAKPEGTFFIWARIPEGENPVEYSGKLLLENGVNCVPGNLISEEFNGVNPGEKHVRFALVPSFEKVCEAAERLTA